MKSKVPFEGLSEAATMSHIVRGKGPDLSKVRADCSLLLRAFLEEGMALEPARRPSFAELAQRFCSLDSFLAQHMRSAQVGVLKDRKREREIGREIRYIYLFVFSVFSFFFSSPYYFLIEGQR